MQEIEALGAMGQLGSVGLIVWAWLTERRGAAERDRRLVEAHQRLVSQRTELGAVLTALRENTRALGGLEATQRALMRTMGRSENPIGRYEQRSRQGPVVQDGSRRAS